MTDHLTLVLGLVRQARTSGEFTEFAQAALIDAEVDLEHLAEAPPPWASVALLSPRACVEQALALLEQIPDTEQLRGWLAEALTGQAS
ncbi:MAG TPA: hypothetical protein GXZ45_01705 [Propionibacterium sp.]|nr:hypothetical protein [Propionibacterium sp.]